MDFRDRAELNASTRHRRAYKASSCSTNCDIDTIRKVKFCGAGARIFSQMHRNHCLLPLALIVCLFVCLSVCVLPGSFVFLNRARSRKRRLIAGVQSTFVPACGRSRMFILHSALTAPTFAYIRAVACSKAASWRARQWTAKQEV